MEARFSPVDDSRHPTNDVLTTRIFGVAPQRRLGYDDHRFLPLMRRTRIPNLALALSAAFSIFALPTGAPAQDYTVSPRPLTAHSRLFPSAGTGLEELRRNSDGNYLVLATPGKSIGVYAPDGKPLGDVPSNNHKHPALVSATDFDTDAQGRLYVADRGAEAVKILDAKGSLVRAIPNLTPASITVLPDGDFAVTDLKSRHLLDVYSRDGKLLLGVGAFSEEAEHEKLNRFLNLGRVAADVKGHLYFAFSYFPEPTLRKYKRDGEQDYEAALNTLEFEPEAQAIRRVIRSQDQREGDPSLKPIINAIGVDAASERVWMAMGNILVEFDSDGSRMGTYQTYTSDGDVLKPVAILVEPGRLLLSADPAGIYEFVRPDIKASVPSQRATSFK
jgi:hypothetical protein